MPSPPPSSSALVDAVRGIKSSGDGLPELIDIEDEGEAGMRIKAEVKGKGSSMIWFFFFFAVYNVADGGINSLITSLAGSMTTQVSTMHTYFEDELRWNLILVRAFQMTSSSQRECTKPSSLITANDQQEPSGNRPQREGRRTN